MLEVERRECHTESESHDDLSDSDIHPNLNHIEVDSRAGHLLLMLEVQMRDCHTKSKLPGG